MSKAAGSVEKRSGFSEFALDVRSGWYSRISPYKDEYKAVMGAAPAGRKAEFHGLAVERIKARKKAESANYAGRVFAGFTMGQGLAYGLQIGGDQLGTGMKNYWRTGSGWNAAQSMADAIPNSRGVGAALKAIEIGLDGSRAYFEMKILRKAGYVADGVPTLIGMRYGQPLWSSLEATQKLIDAVMNLDMIGTPQQIVYSLGNIVNSSVRYVIDGFIWWKGAVVQRAYEHKVFGRLLRKRVEKGKKMLDRNNSRLEKALGGEKAKEVVAKADAAAAKWDTNVPYEERKG